MNGAGQASAVVSVSGVAKRFVAHKQVFDALIDVSLTAQPGAITALIGADGSGKTTLMRLIAGLLRPDAGSIAVLGLDAATQAQAIQSRIGYMPQRFGLYEDLTVQENLDLYADLHGVTQAERQAKYPRLMEMTALGPFTRRLAGQLSGGMKQKLGLACTLIATPDLLLLDEPTAGVDPLSRRELWDIIRGLVQRDGLPVLVSTSYLDEADRCDQVTILSQGRVLATGEPAAISRAAEGKTFLLDVGQDETARDLQAEMLSRPEVADAAPDAGQVRLVLANPEAVVAIEGAAGRPLIPVAARFEDGFMALLRENARASELPSPSGLTATRKAAADAEPEIQVTDLVRRFGGFTAVDHVSFEVARGQIFGLLGPNGAGKTTVFRMLCGLLAVSGGELRLGGVDMRRARAAARARLGYVAQKFSLYALLSVRENLDFFASVYGLRGAQKRSRIDWAMAEFELGPYGEVPGGHLAGGFKQRLAMAAALLHEPELLFLDEPTSGADPVARRDFWRRISALAQKGVTVIVTTHFMAEAEYCDRIAILDAGRILAQGDPAAIRARGRVEAGRVPTMEDAFISIVEDRRRAAQAHAA